ncbi:MAG: putative repair protein recO [Chlamydiales bacterium]|jgi:DNA repair protein RecO (recombination protein O)|nr:putative repair protein recO [Chlamydiales bacterium]
MSIKSLEGIVLENKTHRSDDSLLTLFTKQEGIITAFARYGQSARSRLHSLTVPLTQAEFHGTGESGQLFLINDGTVLQQHLHLRNDEQKLLAGVQMTKAVLKVLWQQQPAPAVYSLLLHYLKAMGKFPLAETLLWSFWCKILKHEGKFFPAFTCSACGEEFQQEVKLYQGELLCHKHQTQEVVPLEFEQEEIQQLIVITHGRSLKDLEQVVLSEELIKKLRELVDRVLERKI